MTVHASSRPAAVSWKLWAAVAVGAFLGTESRYLIGLLLPEAGGTFPWTTFAINVAGSFLLGCLTGSWAGRDATPAWVQAGLGPGLLGSFTTFSAVSLVGVAHPSLLVPYFGLTLAAGLATAAVGVWFGRRRSA